MSPNEAEIIIGTVSLILLSVFVPLFFFEWYHRRKLISVCRRLIEYRNRTGPLGFQLEKADLLIDMIRNELE